MKSDVLVIVLAGGEGSRLHPLTNFRAKPAVPIGGKFRLIDIPLSNAANCGLRKSIILTQGKDASLIKHLKDVWYSDSRFGVSVDIISPQISGSTYKGDADAVRQVVDRLKTLKPDYVLVVPGDHLLKMDYSNFVDFLASSNAGAVIAVKPELVKYAKHLGSIHMNSKQKIIGFYEKNPDTPYKFIDKDNQEVFYASMGIYAFKRTVLIKALSKKGDFFGKDIIPSLLSNTKVLGYDYKTHNIIVDTIKISIKNHLINSNGVSSDSDYWKDVGTIKEYFKANMDLVSITPRFNLYGEKWPFYTENFNLGPGKIIKPHGEGCINNVLLSEGSFLSDSEASSIVISPKSIIDKSRLEEVIIFNNSTIHECDIKRTIIDKNVILKNMRIGFDEEEDRKNGIYIDELSKIRIVPKNYDHTSRFFEV